jgi:hypothetical protein
MGEPGERVLARVYATRAFSNSPSWNKAFPYATHPSENVARFLRDLLQPLITEKVHAQSIWPPRGGP